ncbi:MAG: DUF885 family protein [Gammaproteobacteria bacterium]
MRTTLRWFSGLLGLGLLAVIIFAINAIWFRPWSINVFYEKVFVMFALDNPQMLSGMRMLEGLGLRAHNAELNDASPEKVREDFAYMRETIDTLNAYDRDGLTGQDALSYDILKFFLEQQAQSEEFMWHDYPVSQLGGVQGDFPDFMASLHYLGDAKDCEHYVARLNKADALFNQVLEQLRLREEKNIITPRFAVNGALSQVREFVATQSEQNVLLTSYKKRIAKLDEDDRTSCEAQTANVKAALDNVIQPAYRKLETYLVTLLEKATTDHGVWKLPNGDTYYAQKLREHTTTDISAEEVHQLGLREVERISGEMNDILISEGYTEGTVGERMQALGDEPRFTFPNTDEGREAALEEYRRIISEIDAGMAAMFDLTIESAVEVRRVPEFREDGAPGAYYQGPAQDGSRPGIFFANLRDMNETVRFAMRTLAYHEAVPGHHYQTSLQTELTDVPMFRRMLGFTAFSEGWALYAERLAWEQGFQDDPYDNLGRLQDEMLRAVRLVVDSGLHAKRWSREDAIDYMIRYTGQERGSVVTEIERYMVWPGQATAYKIGMLKILELREKARTALGERFDIRDFHRAVLGNGDVPLFLLERQIDHYIEMKKAG